MFSCSINEIESAAVETHQFVLRQMKLVNQLNLMAIVIRMRNEDELRAAGVRLKKLAAEEALSDEMLAKFLNGERMGETESLEVEQSFVAVVCSANGCGKLDAIRIIGSMKV